MGGTTRVRRGWGLQLLGRYQACATDSGPAPGERREGTGVWEPRGGACLLVSRRFSRCPAHGRRQRSGLRSGSREATGAADQAGQLAPGAGIPGGRAPAGRHGRPRGMLCWAAEDRRHHGWPAAGAPRGRRALGSPSPGPAASAQVPHQTTTRRRNQPMLRQYRKMVRGVLDVLWLVATGAGAAEMTCSASDGKGNCTAAIGADGKAVVVVGEGVKVGDTMACVDKGSVITCTALPA